MCHAINQLVNDTNVIQLTSELLNYLIIASNDQKTVLSSKIMSIVEKYSPSLKWRYDTIITMLTLTGNLIDENVIRIAILFIAQSSQKDINYSKYVTHLLYNNILLDLNNNNSQNGLILVGIWVIGEFGDLLTQNVSITDTIDNSVTNFNGINEIDILNLLDKLLKLHNADNSSKSLILNALIKLAIRFNTIKTTNIIINLLKPYQTSISLELQQRSNEYIQILNNNNLNNIRNELLSKMPIIDENTLRKRRNQLTQLDDNFGMNATSSATSTSMTEGFGISVNNFASPNNNNNNHNNNAASLLDLDDIFGGGMSTILTTNNTQSNINTTPSSFGNKPINNNNNATTTVDLLSDIFSYNPTPVAPINQTTNNNNNNNNYSNPMDLFGNNNVLPMQPPPINNLTNDIFGLSLNSNNNNTNNTNTSFSNPNPIIHAFDKNGLKVSQFHFLFK